MEEHTLPRLLSIALPLRQSAFLWGARKTAKSTYLRAAFPDSVSIDLLQTDVMLEMAKRPALLREQLLAAPVRQLQAPIIIDEIQKVPHLLDEIHWPIVGRGEVAIVVKGTSRVDSAGFRGLRAFVGEHCPRRAILVCNERRPRVHDGVDVLPWREFLARLWGGDLLPG